MIIKSKIQNIKSTTLSAENIHERIVKFLNGKDYYRIVQNTGQYISFDGRIGKRFKSNLEYYTVNEGHFDITIGEHANTVRLVCELNITFEVIVIAISIICASFVAHVWFIGSFVLSLNLLAKFYFKKNESKDMIDSILK